MRLPSIKTLRQFAKPAAPVCEREAFEREMSKPPFEFCMDRWPDDGSSYAWPGNYAAYHTQCAWDAWQACAALSAGAPELLDSLRALTHSLDPDHFEHDDQREAFKQAVAAITKATGATHD